MQDNDVKGLGNSYSAMYWEYDSRTGRRWNLDPKPTADVSEYGVFNNNPIWFCDPFGDTTRNGQKYEPKDMQHATFLDQVTVTAKKKPKPERNFDEWYSGHRGQYSNRLDAYKSWQSDPGYHNGEKFWDRMFRVMASSSMEARRDFASGGMNMYGGYGSAIRAAEAAEAAESVWALGPSPRGFAIEARLGGNLPANFPVIDRFANGVATSIKSIDLAASKYQSINTLTNLIDDYITKVKEFNGRSWGGVQIQATQIQARALTIAVPKGVGTAEQMAVLQQAIRTGASKGVQVTIVPIK